MQKTTDNRRIRDHYLNTYQPPDIAELQDFLNRAERDASARAGDRFDGTPLTALFADAESNLIAKLRDLVTKDAQARIFVRRWRRLVETTNSDEYPHRHGTVFARTDDATWTIGAHLLRACVTLFDAFVQSDVVRTYRTLGTVSED